MYKVTSKINADEALNDDFFQTNNANKSLNVGLKNNGDEALNAENK